MKNSQNGEIATIIAITTLIVIGASTIVSTLFLNKSNTTKTRADERTQTCSAGVSNGYTCGSPGEYCFACTGNQGPCSGNQGVGVPYQCQNGRWTVINQYGECNYNCKAQVAPPDGFQTSVCSYIKSCVYSEAKSDGPHCYTGYCSPDNPNCEFNDGCQYRSDCSSGVKVDCPKVGQAAAPSPTATPTPTHVPTATPFPTVTLIPTDSPTPTLAPTVTLIPTEASAPQGDNGISDFIDPPHNPTVTVEPTVTLVPLNNVATETPVPTSTTAPVAQENNDIVAWAETISEKLEKGRACADEGGRYCRMTSQVTNGKYTASVREGLDDGTSRTGRYWCTTFAKDSYYLAGKNIGPNTESVAAMVAYWEDNLQSTYLDYFKAKDRKSVLGKLKPGCVMFDETAHRRHTGNEHVAVVKEFSIIDATLGIGEIVTLDGNRPRKILRYPINNWEIKNSYYNFVSFGCF